MGGSASNHGPPPQLELAELMKNGSPMMWTPTQVAKWVQLHNSLPQSLRKRMCENILTSCVDGEALCEAPFDLLVQWIQLSPTEEVQLASLLANEIMNHPMVQPFTDAGPRDDNNLEDSESHTPSFNMDAFAQEQSEAVRCIMAFHQYTFNSLQRGSPTVKRIWAFQPKVSRRYYGSPITKLASGLSGPALDRLMFYSLAVSARQNSQMMSSPRSASSKRVNPSSGGLHPVEAYVIHSATNTLQLEHYSPAHHGLELRVRVEDEAKDTLPAGCYIIALTVIQWREIWKYGPRGWRYTQLDVGHAIGSLLLAAHLVNYDVQVLDSGSVGGADDLLGLQTINSTADHREEEHAAIFVALRPSGTAEIDLAGLLTRLVPKFQVGEVLGTANTVFSRSNEPMQWPYVPCVEAATAMRPSSILFLQVPAGPEDVFSDKKVLAKAIRERRSALNFLSENIDPVNLFACLGSVASLEDGGNAMVGAADGIQLGLWVQGVESVPAGRYLMTRGPLPAAVATLIEQRIYVEYQHPEMPNAVKLFQVHPEPVETDQGASTDQSEEALRKEASQFSCFQNIANDCSVVVSMLVPLEAAIAKNPRAYRYLHWKAGLLGQMLYVAAYQQQLGATGMGCFLDTEAATTFRAAGLCPLYHFAIGVPERDGRFTTF